jgi:ABC-type nitrate/sulfonate/bicarbonate transport system substrate-binding protein
VPSLVTGRVDAVVSFWNAEGVALRRRGVATREFRVDSHGAPRYPELVLATTAHTRRERRTELEGLLATIAAGTRAALADRDAAVADIVAASGADAPLVRAQLDAVAPALRPPVRLDRGALAGWARFAARFGILARPPDTERAFPR